MITSTSISTSTSTQNYSNQNLMSLISPVSILMFPMSKYKE